MNRVALVVLGCALLAAPAWAVDTKRSSAGTLARPAVEARPAKPAEIAKDATPPKPGRSRGASDIRTSTRSTSSRTRTR